MRRTTSLAATVALLLYGVAALAGAIPAASDDFYKGKRLTILVNYAAGGPTDLEARVLAQHIGRHIPGNPTIIIQDMGGAGGLIGAKYLGEVAPADGTVMGYFSGASQRYATNPELFTVDLKTYEFVATVPSGRVHFVRTDVKPGLKTGADLVKAENIVVGGLGAENPKDLAMRLTLEMLGVKYKYFTGYNSTPSAMLAMQRDEINYYADSPPDYLGQIEPVLVRDGSVMPVYFDPVFDGEKFERPRQMGAITVPAFPDFYKAVKGREPSGPLWEAYKAMLAVNGTLYRLLTLPPKAPKAAVETLRTAVAALNTDAAYRADAQKAIGEAPEYVSGDDLNARVAKALYIAPEVRTFMKDYARSGDQFAEKKSDARN